MNIKTSFNNGLRLETPGGTRLLCACKWNDDPLFVIEGNLLKKFATAREQEPCKVETLPSGTIVRLWDEEANHPVLGVID